MTESWAWKRWVLVGGVAACMSAASAAGGWVLRGIVDEAFDEGSRSVTVTGRVMSPDESGDPKRVCVVYDKALVRPADNALGMGPGSSDVGACGTTAVSVAPDSNVEGTLVLVGEGEDAYTAWTELRARP